MLYHQHRTHNKTFWSGGRTGQRGNGDKANRNEQMMDGMGVEECIRCNVAGGVCTKKNNCIYAYT